MMNSSKPSIHDAAFSRERSRQFARDAARFLVAGGTNTALTLVIYQILLFFISAPVAYTITWFVSLTLVSVFYPTHVFRLPRAGPVEGAIAVIVYLVGFLIGLAVISFLSDEYKMERAAIFAALMFTACFNFLAMKVAFHFHAPPKT